MTFRLIEPEEWAQLEPVFAAEGGTLPNPEQSTAIVALDDDGSIAGFWALQQVFHAGPLWIRPDQRGTGLWRALHSELCSMFDPHPGTGYYSFSADERMDHVFTELGYRPLGYKVWAREVK